MERLCDAEVGLPVARVYRQDALALVDHLVVLALRQLGEGDVEAAGLVRGLRLGGRFVLVRPPQRVDRLEVELARLLVLPQLHQLVRFLLQEGRLLQVVCRRLPLHTRGCRLLLSGGLGRRGGGAAGTGGGHLLGSVEVVLELLLAHAAHLGLGRPHLLGGDVGHPGHHRLGHVDLLLELLVRHVFYHL